MSLSNIRSTSALHSSQMPGPGALRHNSIKTYRAGQEVAIRIRLRRPSSALRWATQLRLRCDPRRQSSAINVSLQLRTQRLSLYLRWAKTLPTMRVILKRMSFRRLLKRAPDSGATVASVNFRGENLPHSSTDNSSLLYTPSNSSLSLARRLKLLDRKLDRLKTPQLVRSVGA